MARRTNPHLLPGRCKRVFFEGRILLFFWPCINSKTIDSDRECTMQGPAWVPEVAKVTHNALVAEGLPKGVFACSMILTEIYSVIASPYP